MHDLSHMLGMCHATFFSMVTDNHSKTYAEFALFVELRLA